MRILQHICVGSFIPLFLTTLIIPAVAGPDLDVAFISRTPRYDRYNVTYTYGLDPSDPGTGVPSLSPTEQTKVRWPRMNELVTFKATIKNVGDAASGQFAYKVFFDGVEVKSSTLPSVAAGGETFAVYSWRWDSEQNTHYIKFVVDPDNLIAEDIETNNSREDPTNALCFSFYVWQGLYDWFKTEARKTNPDIACFDDWAQQQIYWMNRLFAEAVYPSSPNGILERVRIDSITVYPESTPDPGGGGTHAPDDMWADGRRGFTTTEYLPIFQSDLSVLNGYMSSCLHELSHQLGLMDLYQLNYEKINNALRPDIGHNNSRAGEMMNNCGGYYSDHSAYAMNSNLHKRRGYFGEYLYDVPQLCKVRLVDAYYRPVPNASIKFYRATGRQFKEPPTFTLTTDAEGYCNLPNRDCLAPTTTATGHVLKDNPWGMINVVGFNAVFFCEITKNSQTDYQYMEILPFNIAYRAGFTQSYTYDMQTTIIPEGYPTSNTLYGIKMTSAKNGYAVGAGGTILKWDGATWTAMPSPVTTKLNAVDALSDSSSAIAVGDGGVVLIYSGSNWILKYIGTIRNLKACAMISPNIFIAVGDRGTYYRSTDGGNTWNFQNITAANIKSIGFYDSTRGLMVSDGRYAFTTKNGGVGWTQGTDELSYYWLTNDCCMSSPTEAWIANGFGDIQRTIDGGTTWDVFTGIGYDSPINCVDIKPGGNGWYLSSAKEYTNVATAERMKNYKWWVHNITTFGDRGDFYDISAISGDDAWAVGEGGLIIHFVENNIDQMTKGKLSDILKLPNGTAVVITDSVVTGSFDGEVYVESYPDRACGIKVLTTKSMIPKTAVYVTGVIDTEGLERVIRYGDFMTGAIVDLKPLAMTGKSIKGCTADPQLNTIPLLIRLAGRVTARNEADGWFTVDDGSNKFDASGNPGVKVTVTGRTPPAKDSFVIVTGISSFETVEGQTYPLIRTRDNNDILP